MGYKDKKPPVFLLCKDTKGWQSSDSLYQMQEKPKHVVVPRGCLLTLAERSMDHSKYVTVTVAVTDFPGVKASVLTKDMMEVSVQQGELLAAVLSQENRYQLLCGKQLEVKIGDLVLYCAHGEQGVPAVVRYIGHVPELRPRGHVLGLEVTSPGWNLGDTDGTVGCKVYFRVETCKGVFCDIGFVRTNIDIHSKEKLESFNKGTVERITALMDNINIKNANYNQYREEGGSKHSSNNIENYIPHKVKVTDVKQINNHRSTDNDSNKGHIGASEPPSASRPIGLSRGSQGSRDRLGARQAASPPSTGSEAGTRKEQPHHAPRNQNYSWDPNSSSKPKQRSRNSSTLSREGLRDTRDSSRGRQNSDIISQRLSLNESPEMKTSQKMVVGSVESAHHKIYCQEQHRAVGGQQSRLPMTEPDMPELMPGYSSPQGGGWHLEDDGALRRSASGSASIDIGYIGQDRDTPPFLPPRDRDCFLTPSLEPVDGLEPETWPQQHDTRTWSKVLSSSRTPSPNQRLAPTPPEEEESCQQPQFVAVCEGAEGEGEVGVESMVQLQTVEGEHMFGVVRYVGDHPGGAPHTNSTTTGKWAGVEMENEVKGGHNGFVSNRRLFTCPPGKGVMVPMSHLVADPRFKESLPQQQQQDFGGIECPAIVGHTPPHPTVDPDAVSSISGRNKGIQGHQNSCYLDATLFSMFCFTSAFDSLLYRPKNKEDISKYEEVQRVLRDEIVNPLRQRLYVRADRVMNLRHMLDSLSDVTGLTDQEKDPEEFLSSLLTQVMKAEPFLELSSGQSTHHYQLFVERDPELPLPSVQDLFDQSFNSSRVKLRRAPPVLILQMPRFGRQFKVYDRILPSQLLDVTDIIEASPRQCVICGVLAEWECAQCFGDHDSGLQSTAFCSACLNRIHQHVRRTKHKAERLKTPAGWDKRRSQPIPRIYMELVAVVCIETSHYVSFVRCGDSPRAPWCFFDSMADRKGEQNGYNIPEMTPAPEVEKILSDSGAADFKANRGPAMGDQAKRLVSDAYMCFYQSPDVRMYR